MVTFNDADEFFETVAEGGGTAYRFKDIEGVGPKTAAKLKSVPGVNAPQDVADYTAEDLAEESGISKSRAAKVIQGGGGNPSRDNQTRSGSVSAGNLASQMEESQQQATGLVQERKDVFKQLVETGEKVPDRRERRRNPQKIPFYEEDVESVRQVGQAADIFSEATSDPLDPTEEKPDLGFDEEDREKAAQVRLAAQRVLEERQGIDFDEASSKTRGSASDPPELDSVDSAFGSSMLTVGEFEVSSSAQEEAREAYSERSPESRQVDSRRRAPVTTDVDRYESRPGELDFPGIDTPSESPQVKTKDRGTVDADETTLEENTGSLFIRENKTSGGTIGSLKGVFSGGRSPGRGVTEEAEEVAQESVGFGTENPDRSQAVADVTLLERDKDGFGEELIPFGAEESDRQSFEF